MLISATRLIILTMVHLQELYFKKTLPVIQTSAWYMQYNKKASTLCLNKIPVVAVACFPSLKRRNGGGRAQHTTLPSFQLLNESMSSCVKIGEHHATWLTPLALVYYLLHPIPTCRTREFVMWRYTLGDLLGWDPMLEESKWFSFENGETHINLLLYR